MEKSKTTASTKLPPKIQVVGRSRPASSSAALPAQAGSVIAQEPSPDIPVDLTGETFITGTARAYAGGVTASAGADSDVVRAGDVASRATPGSQLTAPSRASAVSLADQSWSCPWPREADAEQIDQETVVIRVVVGADGKPESAAAVSDPGHGFAAAATTCAMRTRFNPAHDRAGEPTRARSPPIRVLFTR
jgi:protein TonB